MSFLFFVLFFILSGAMAIISYKLDTSERFDSEILIYFSLASSVCFGIASALFLLGFMIAFGLK